MLNLKNIKMKKLLLFATIIAMVMQFTACSDQHNPVNPTAATQIETKVTGELPGTQGDSKDQAPPLFRMKVSVYNSSGTQYWGGTDTMSYYPENFPWENGISHSGIIESSALVKVNLNWQNAGGKNIKFRKDNTTSTPLIDINLTNASGEQNFQQVFPVNGSVPYGWLQFYINTYTLPTRAKK